MESSWLSFDAEPGVADKLPFPVLVVSADVGFTSAFLLQLHSIIEINKIGSIVFIIKYLVNTPCEINYAIVMLILPAGLKKSSIS